MLWVYNHYKYFHSYSAGIDNRRQNLTSVSAVRVKGSKIISILAGQLTGEARLNNKKESHKLRFSLSLVFDCR